MRLQRLATATPTAPWGAVFGAVLLLAAALAFVWLKLGLPQPGCAFREWTGVPCPGCGTTRMVEAVFRGEWLEALAWNPLVFVTLSALAGWGVASAAGRALRRPAWRLVLDPGERVIARIAAAATIAAGWIYLILRGV